MILVWIIGYYPMPWPVILHKEEESKRDKKKIWILILRLLKAAAWRLFRTPCKCPQPPEKQYSLRKEPFFSSLILGRVFSCLLPWDCLSYLIIFLFSTISHSHVAIHQFILLNFPSFSFLPLFLFWNQLPPAFPPRLNPFLPPHAHRMRSIQPERSHSGRSSHAATRVPLDGGFDGRIEHGSLLRRRPRFQPVGYHGRPLHRQVCCLCFGLYPRSPVPLILLFVFTFVWICPWLFFFPPVSAIQTLSPWFCFIHLFWCIHGLFTRFIDLYFHGYVYILLRIRDFITLFILFQIFAVSWLTVAVFSNDVRQQELSRW